MDKFSSTKVRCFLILKCFGVLMHCLIAFFSTQHSNFSSKTVGKIIAEAKAKKTFASALPRQFFANAIKQISVFALAISWQSSEVTSLMLFYLINHYIKPL